MSWQQQYTDVEIGEDHVVLKEPSGRVRVGKILEKLKDKDGQVVSVLTDRIMKDRYGSPLRGWYATGCVVTELIPEHLKPKPKDPYAI